MRLLSDISNRGTFKKTATYVLRHVQSGVRYVGSTSDIRSRLTSHHGKLMRQEHASSRLQAAFNGHPDIQVEVLLYTDDREQAFEMEQKIINEYLNKGIELFNSSKDVRNPGLGLVVDDVGRAQRSLAAKALWSRPGYREAMLKIHQGKKRPPGTAEKILAARGLVSPGVRVLGTDYAGVQAAADAMGLTYSQVYNRCISKSSQYKDWCLT